MFGFFFFKQKTAYEMRISDWSSDVCSSDLEDGDAKPVNTATALWTRSRTEIADDEYKAFYKHLSHDFSDPLAWSHNRVEGKKEYTSLLYIPEHAPFEIGRAQCRERVCQYV